MRRSYLLIRFAFSLTFLFLLFGIWLMGCSPAPDFWKEAKEGQKRILVSFPPLYCITHAIAGEDAYVLCMLTSQGPHAQRDSKMLLRRPAWRLPANVSLGALNPCPK
jgi:hypothetical protein